MLVQYQTPVHTSDVYGAFPIHYASQLSGVNSANDETIIDPIRGLAILKKLIELNVDVDCTDEQKRTPFLWAASAGERRQTSGEEENILLFSRVSRRERNVSFSVHPPKIASCIATGVNIASLSLVCRCA